MKVTKEQLQKINEINEVVKDLDPILKERIIDYELYELFKDDYLKIAPFIKKEGTQTNLSNETYNVIEQTAVEKDESIPSLKDFFNEKQPLSAIETVVIFGFYLEYFEKKKEFGEKDISNAFFEARVRKPKVIGQSLRDAKNVKGYLVEGSKRGKFRLSNEGENLVMHDLPRKSKTKP
ncbi:MAG: hypothetical protein ACFFD2_26695 [Promethearchaeota archaeon]